MINRAHPSIPGPHHCPTGHRVGNDCEIVIVTEGGREKRISRAEFERNQADMRRKVISKAEMMLGQAESWLDFCREAEITASGADGLLNAFTSFVVSVANDKTDPPYAPLNAARAEAMALRAMASSPRTSWARIRTQDGAATRAYNAGVVAFKGFINARIGTAGSIVGKLETVRDLSFSVVETYATARFVAAGHDPVKARRMAAAGTAAMKTGAGQLGEFLAGNKVTWQGSAKKVFVDASVAAVKKSFGGKVSGDAKKEVTKRIGMFLAAKLSKSLGKKALDTWAAKFTESQSIQQLISKAGEEAVGVFKPMLEKGEVPSKKDVEEAVMRVIGGSLEKVGPIKALEAFDRALPGRVRGVLAEVMGSDVTKSVLTEMTAKHGPAVVSKLPDAFGNTAAGQAAGEVLSKALDIYVQAAADGSRSDTSEIELHRLGGAALQADGGVRDQMKRIIRARAEKELEALLATA